MNNPLFLIGFPIFFLLLQVPATLVLLKRLSTARDRTAPLLPLEFSAEALAKQDPKVSIVIPTLNEIDRLPICLEGLRDQAAKEIIVVDSRSQDGTPEYVQKLQKDFPIPLKLITDDPLPEGWVGRPWALHTGFLNSDPTSEWVLGIDADTLPQKGLVASFVDQATVDNFDIVSLSPKFILKTAGEQWLQPALLITLIFRFGATGDRTQFTEDRVMANGQCFLSKRAKLVELNGYELAKSSFCDDVTLARAAAQRGAKVGFLDGAALMQVRMYTSMAETWREWGRSLDLKDASTPSQTFADCLLLTAVQGLPILMLIALSIWQPASSILMNILFCLNAFLVFIRCLLVFGIRTSYTEVGFWFWLSPLADPVAVIRIWISALTKPKSWRGRTYT
ncbi:MAG: glycosyltransferase [Pseudanabaena sp. M135S2SP2A07QC]|nr:glycosyltransferase [Pseudanabaena sp. M090S1SP2A07QC]MCA6508300.1 glycosyltransferase [Pseudanabaena sp. M172S2SP2A07QC]MCA6517123.1 glycosyltransferase [Pseudanabaena sp. M110S1SP2A07QC]MCA6523777.1 glycosyltransferase [Pseudanabaena sp. M051S1SP2A07QC]MCA6526083.1 glycosyltransferase [Pseudanabaena sp. M179S2SP2A07QC]MCA6530343.1 glycosyltransferase [Pseudanabaena sp. M125S2SP2A07QC]MCA6534264.1 glycosyltransferase [Pseudanabaena sp. M176S2SP2A07QC]MCA6541074.1 glycosyltransferase [Pse